MGSKTFRSIGTANNGSNLTELNATESVANGFMDHADWMAHVVRYAVVMKHVKKYYSTELLDVGCGKMQLLMYLWRNRCKLDNFNYTGLDLRAIEQWLDTPLPLKANIELVQMNLVTDPTESIHPSELVVCTEVLEHVDKKFGYELVKRLYNWTKPGGTLFFSSPNLGGSDTVAENHTGPNGEPREWTYAGKAALLQKAGFNIEHAMGTFIRLDHLPEEFTNIPQVNSIKDLLPNAFFRVFAAVPYPELSNNTLFICKRP